MPKRPDAELVKTSKFRELEFYVMKGRNESAIYADKEIDITHTSEFIKNYNKGKKGTGKVSLFHVIVAACVRCITLRPRMNRFVTGRRLWQRNQIILSFVVNKEHNENSDEVNAMIEFDPFDTLETVHKTVDHHINQARYGENPNEKDIKLFGSLPRWLISLIFCFARWMDEHNMPIYSITKQVPMWSTCFIAHLGSIGIDAVYHHPFELGTTSILFVIGKIHSVGLRPTTQYKKPIFFLTPGNYL
ncbi:MAG: 2-oxo acid dehydrogenase subunit E2 [Spirochaetales bacterium]|nr:2-oxo acid dehydrogenase subunit E2 [Spirochaetales bacterium]